MGWRDRLEDWDRRALAPDIRTSGGGWPVLFTIAVLLLVVAATFTSIGEWLGALASVAAAVVVGVGGWSARARWRRRN